jgi:SM-20-related protein
MVRASVLERAIAARSAAIADGLAGPGVAVVDGLLGERSAAAVAASLRAAYAAGSFRPACVGADRVAAATVRSDETWWLDEANAPRAVLPLLVALEVLRVRLREELRLPLEYVECHAARYAPGAFYAAHVDELRGSGGRRVSFAWYGNDDWHADDGGALLLGGAAVLPALDRLVVFRADLEHAVQPTTRERFSVTGWMRLARRDPVLPPPLAR